MNPCGRQYKTFDAAILAAELRISKGSKPLEVVGCGFCRLWHILPKGTTIGQQNSRPDPFPPAIRSMLMKRDECCQRCGFTGRLEAHHRRAKASGGSSARSHTQCACNGVMLCRTCHSWVHSEPRKARAEGLIVLQSVSKPATVGIDAIWVEYRDPDATYAKWYPTCEGGVVND